MLEQQQSRGRPSTNGLTQLSNWLDTPEARRLFKGRVYGPILCEVTVENAQYAAMLEQHCPSEAPSGRLPAQELYPRGADGCCSGWGAEDLWHRFVTEHTEDQDLLAQEAERRFRYRPTVTHYAGNVNEAVHHRLGEAHQFAGCRLFPPATSHPPCCAAPAHRPPACLQVRHHCNAGRGLPRATDRQAGHVQRGQPDRDLLRQRVRARPFPSQAPLSAPPVAAPQPCRRPGRSTDAEQFLNDNPDIQRLLTPDSLYMVRTSRYNAAARALNVAAMRPPQLLAVGNRNVEAERTQVTSKLQTATQVWGAAARKPGGWHASAEPGA